MKLSIIPKWMLATLVAAVFLAGGLTGCDDEGDNGVGPGSEGPLDVSTIIVNPKSRAPMDTIRLTAVIVSDSANVGLFPTISWSASGGQFLENGQTSVRWVAPDVSTLVTVSVTARNTINTDSRSTTVFVGESASVLASNAGQLFLTGSTPDDFFYYWTPDPSFGFDIFHYSGGNSSDAADGGLGENLAISASLTTAAFQRDELPNQNLIEPINVHYDDLVSGTSQQITTDGAELLSRRRHQYFNPTVSPDGNLVAYQGLRTAPLATGLDSMDIFVYNTQTTETVAVTETHGVVRKNNVPTFSSDGNWLVFASDRTGEGTPAQWEYYALRVNGADVDTAMAQTVQVTNSNSQIVTISQGNVVPPLQSWNPVDPVLALVMTNGALMQITFDSQGATTAVTPLLSRPRGFAWSTDGSMLAYTDGVSLYTVPSGGTGATIVHQGNEGDQLADMTWSPDQSMIVYRIIRGTIAWFELKPVGSPATEPVVLTPAASSGSLGSYRRNMSLSPVWLASDELLLIRFYGETPGIDLLDISAAIQ